MGWIKPKLPLVEEDKNKQETLWIIVTMNKFFILQATCIQPYKYRILFISQQVNAGKKKFFYFILFEKKKKV